MIFKKNRGLDRFTKDILFVFSGATFANLCNLLYQLFIVRKFSPSEFAIFNTLISIITLFSTPAATLTQAVTRFVAKSNAHRQPEKICLLIAKFSKLTFIFGISLFLIFCIFNSAFMRLLKISDSVSIFIMSGIILLLWIIPVYSGSMQGLERFGWFTALSISNGILKLSFVIIFVLVGWGVAGALGAFLVSSLSAILIGFFSLKDYIFKKIRGRFIEFGETIHYILPVASTWFCFNTLVNLDMVLVKYYFSPVDAGYYSIAQMVGKIFLFLPGPISIVMFPKTAGLNAKQQDTGLILRKSVLLGCILCIAAIAIYNLFPAFCLRLLTTKTINVSITLGRLFSISMSLYALIFILFSYHLSIGDFRFLKSLILFTLAQFMAIALFHRNLF
ncbi:MAG: oligosaccharide flippase family protein, partial [Candidatus Omnitrophica bacterium]|nr:oligosaccharide flippase family protein [Candidatus Omnitrophota bacterium]